MESILKPSPTAIPHKNLNSGGLGNARTDAIGADLADWRIRMGLIWGARRIVLKPIIVSESERLRDLRLSLQLNLMFYFYSMVAAAAVAAG